MLVISYKSSTPPLTITDNEIHINWGEINPSYYKPLDAWKKINGVSIPDGVEVKLIGNDILEFYKEVIALNGIMLDNVTGQLNILMDNLETILAWIPTKQIQLTNLQEELKKDDNKTVINRED